MEYGAVAAASGIYIFRPLAYFDQITVHSSGYMYSTIAANLIDVTAKQQIWNWNGGLFFMYQGDFIPAKEINYDFRIDHIYQLSFAVWAGANNDGDMASIYTNNLTPVFVPEPTAMLLLGFGLMGLLGMRKKCQQ